MVQNNNMKLPDGYHTATPYLMYRNAAGALDFVKSAFGAVEHFCHKDDDGAIRHAEFAIGNSMFMISQENKEYPELRSVEAFGGSPVQIFLYMDDVDAVAAKAVAAGATLRYPIEEKPYGRSCGLADPFGLMWWVTTPPKA